MAHSIYHARSSKRQWGGTVEIYLPLHNWFDSSKALRADFRHRALRHHDQGVQLAELIFGKQIRIYPKSYVATQSIGKRHMQEDFKDCPDASKWYELIQLEPWMNKKLPKELAGKILAKKFGGSDLDYFFLWDFLNCFTTDDPRSNYLLNHSWGIFDAESVFGVTFKRQSDDKDMPTRTMCESILSAQYGRIPTPNDFLNSITEQPWMYINAKQLSQDKELSV